MTVAHDNPEIGDEHRSETDGVTVVAELVKAGVQTDKAIAATQELAPQYKLAATPEQSRIDSVSKLLGKAYDAATTVELTDAEADALTAQFADADFQLGAGGDANLIYIKHPSLRARLDKVFKPLRWALIERKRWANDAGKCVHVFSECVLLVRGAFVAEAVGRMDYWTSNAKVCYDDAAEGAKTNALRRCAKAIGIGLQAWDKDYCDAWKQRNSAAHKPASKPASNNATVQPPAPAHKFGDKRETTAKVTAVNEIKNPRTPDKRAWELVTDTGKYILAGADVPRHEVCKQIAATAQTYVERTVILHEEMGKQSWLVIGISEPPDKKF